MQKLTFGFESIFKIFQKNLITDEKLHRIIPYSSPHETIIN